MKKRIMSLIMTAVLAIAMVCPVMADTGTWSGGKNEDGTAYTSGTRYGGTFTSGEGSEESTGKTKVTATIDSSYTVFVPANLELENTTGDTYEGTYEVGAKGNLAPTKKLHFAPASTFVMKSSEDSNITANGTVSQTVTDWVKGAATPPTEKSIDSLDTEGTMAGWSATTGTASVNLTQAGGYTGTITFTFSLVDKS